MNAIRFLPLALFIALFPIPTFAEDVTTPAVTDHPSTLLAENEPAPFAGVLLTEARLDLILAGRVELAECRGNLEASERVRVGLAEDLAETTAHAATATSSEGSVWPWVVVGFAVGVLASGAAIWGAANLLEAGK